MRVIFDKAAGETLDLLWSLFYIANYDYIIVETKKIGIEPDEEIEKILQCLMNNREIDRKKITFFFNVETRISDALIDMKEVFGKSLEDCLKHVESMSKQEIILRLLKELLKDEVKDKDELNEKAETILEKDKIIDFIKELNISDGAKWNLFCFIEDAESYAKQAAELIKVYAPIYYEEMKKQKNNIDKLYEKFERKLEVDQDAFFNDLLAGNFKLQFNEEISIAITYLHYFSLYFYEIDKSAFFIIGVNYEMYLKKLSGGGEIEKNLIILKNLSDRTRFEIIKLLLKRDYFGQEIAEALKITTATVSYHMNYLFAAQVVGILRKDHKAFYTLRKETIRSGIEFLNKELEL